MLHTSHFNDKYNLIKSSEGITYIFCVLFLKWIREYDKETSLTAPAINVNKSAQSLEQNDTH